MTMRVGACCAGYAGVELGLSAILDCEPAWFCEFAEGPSKILAHRFPEVPNYGDLTAVDWSQVEPVDILTAGFPCQDVSAAGARAGLKHGTRSGVFHGVMVAVRALRPRLVLLENVMGLFTADCDEWPDSVTALHAEWQHCVRVVALIDAKIKKATRQGRFDGDYAHRKRAERVRASRRERVAVAGFRRERDRLVPRAIATVLGSLAEAGYNTEWMCVRASDVGAPHKRERVFLAAKDTYTAVGDQWRFAASRETSGGWAWSDVGGSGGARVVADAEGAGPQGQAGGRVQRGESAAGGGFVADAEGAERGGPESGDLAAGRGGAAEPGECVSAGAGGGATVADTGREYGQWWADPVGVGSCSGAQGESGGDNGAAADTTGGIQPDESHGSDPKRQSFGAIAGAGRRDHAGRTSEGVHEMGGTASVVDWGAYRPAVERWEHVLGRPAPAPTEPGARGGRRLAPVFVEWMQGLPAGWVTGVPDLSRNEQLKALGNGVVPQQAAAAYSMLLRDLLEWAA